MSTPLSGTVVSAIKNEKSYTFKQLLDDDYSFSEKEFGVIGFYSFE